MAGRRSGAQQRQVGREPDGVADVPALDEGENVGELKLAAARLPANMEN